MNNDEKIHEAAVARCVSYFFKVPIYIRYFFYRQGTEQYEELNREMDHFDNYSSLKIGLDDSQNRY